MKILKFGNSGYPGIGDVSKQFLYSLVFKDLPFDTHFNCFLFPKIQSVSFEQIGYIEFSLFPNLRIFNVFLSVDLVFDTYLGIVNPSHEFLSQLQISLSSVR